VCPKGLEILNLDRDPDRVTTPLRRAADGEFEPISWADAFNLVEARLKAVQLEHRKGRRRRLFRNRLHPRGSIEILLEIAERMGGGMMGVRPLDALLRGLKVRVTPATIAGVALRTGP
jgi:anaerobic selenocysteine-containing dehydrogenase